MEKVTPGLHPNFRLYSYSELERQIITTLSKEWYITDGGDEIILGPSSYRYVLIKPTLLYQEMFNIERELVVIFSSYPIFQPRTLDAIETVTRRYQALRLERICSVVISKDALTESKLRDLLKSDEEAQVIVPFTYNELLTKPDEYFIRNRFKNHFYTRDLFAFESPLRKDLYFFGRNDLVHGITNRHKSNENAALFGLRKTGKTSVIFGVERALHLMDAKSVFIDCQNPAFHKRRWNKALFYILWETNNQHHLNMALPAEEKFTEENAPLIFEKELWKIHRKLAKQSILLIFDEIENITFSISPSHHWEKELDFVFFWQTLRSLFQKLKSVFTYLIVGTNAMCVEVPTIYGKDNPIFNQVPFEYMPGFDVPQTRDMVRTLGSVMGLNFDEILYGKLTEDFGGHPFLMRHVCSVINGISPAERPTLIGKASYYKAKDTFNRDYSNYISMILTVLREFYSDEYAMMEYLARGDTHIFEEIARSSPYYTSHLLGYGIIDQSHNGYSFKIESVREYLLNKDRYKKLQLSDDEKLREISERRNALELKLRGIVRNQLRAAFGKAKAKDMVLKIFGDPRKSQYVALPYEDLFNASVTNIYFEDLRKIIIRNWEPFQYIFGLNKEDVDLKMQGINKHRADAHAKKVGEDDMSYFRVCITALEKGVSDFLL